MSVLRFSNKRFDRIFHLENVHRSLSSKTSSLLGNTHIDRTKNNKTTKKMKKLSIYGHTPKLMGLVIAAASFQFAEIAQGQSSITKVSAKIRELDAGSKPTVKTKFLKKKKELKF